MERSSVSCLKILWVEGATHEPVNLELVDHWVLEREPSIGDAAKIYQMR